VRPPLGRPHGSRRRRRGGRGGSGGSGDEAAKARGQRGGLSLGGTFLTLYALPVVVGFVVLVLARLGLVRLPAYVVGALIVVLAVLIAVAVAWLLWAGASLG
jgi:hypothetical protein